MTTEDTGTTIETRSIEELRKLTTYQGMTDTEIQSLIDYYKQQSYQEGYTACETAASTAAQAQAVSDSQKAWEAAQESLTTATATAAQFQTIVNTYTSPTETGGTTSE